jgi:RND family efflux transporter MFP subunit
LWRLLQVGLPLGTIGVLVLVSVGGENPAVAAARPAATPRRVEVAPVELLESRRPLRYSGIVRAADRAELAFTVPGRLAHRPVELGDRVKRGQLLAALDAGQFVNAREAARARVQDVQARLAQLRRDQVRVERLLEAHAVGSEEAEQVRSGLEAAEAGLAAATAELAEAERLVRESRLVAPFAGSVAELRLQPGEYAQPGWPVVRLSGAGELEVEVEVPEAQRLGLEPGAEVSVELPLVSGGRLTGRIASLGRAASVAGRLFPVVVALAEADGVVPGVTAEVELSLGVETLPSVPVAAVVDPGGRAAAVFRAVGGRVERVPVSVRELVGSRVTVEAALGPGDEVVVAGHANLLDGASVELAR